MTTNHDQAEDLGNIVTSGSGVTVLHEFALGTTACKRVMPNV
jgi:hypothetical protein